MATAACALAAAIVVAAQSDVLGGPASSSAAGTRPATAAKGQESGPATTPPSPPTGRRPLSASGPNPLDDDDVRLFTPPNGDLSREVELKTAIGRTEDAALLRALAKVPQSVWLEGSGAVARRTVAATLKGAAKTGSVPVFVTAGIPLRDCHEHGTQSGSAYRSWISGIAAEIGDARAVVILEPNSLVKLPATNECEKGDAKAQRERFQNLAFAVREFGELSHTAVYLDGSFESWPEPSEMSRRLIQARIDEADGFFLNASNYQPTDGLVRYGNRLARCIRFQFVKGTGDCPGTEIAAVPGDPSALPHFVIDTSRNGRGEWVPDKTYPEPETWCNPPGRGVGLRPTTETGDELVDAYLWIFEPGRSNGACTRGTDGPEDPVYGKVIPYGGRFWPEMALERARLANPPLR
ncbi:glycoside hydrolase family 6 protein [Thermocatellispora tengchongensis]|uniref:glycoside hydrolase family 6 protein n=1 Tax=Thermocatellispora tengchongensis TaxID=1073253 RepID=UPI00363F4524